MTGSVQLIKCHNSPRIERAVPITNAENINIHFLFKYFRVMRKITDPKKLTRPEIRYKFKVFWKCNTKIDLPRKIVAMFSSIVSWVWLKMPTAYISMANLPENNINTNSMLRLTKGIKCLRSVKITQSDFMDGSIGSLHLKWSSFTPRCSVMYIVYVLTPNLWKA